MKMNPWWMFTILVGCRSPLGARSQDTCNGETVGEGADVALLNKFNMGWSSDQLKTVCVPAGDKVFVPCPKSPGKDVQFNLLQDGQVTHNHSCSNRRDARSCEPLLTGDGVELHEHPGNESVSFILTGVTAGRHGIYRCEGVVIVPPPLKKVPSDSGVLLLVEGHQCKQDCRGGITEGGPHWICGLHWICIVAVVSSYSAIVTITAIIIWVKSRRTESEAEYMNAKPRAEQVRRKKRGIQNPFPRHF